MAVLLNQALCPGLGDHAVPGDQAAAGATATARALVSGVLNDAPYYVMSALRVAGIV
jgi:hypothetical protein